MNHVSSNVNAIVSAKLNVVSTKLNVVSTKLNLVDTSAGLILGAYSITEKTLKSANHAHFRVQQVKTYKNRLFILIFTSLRFLTVFPTVILP